MAILSRAIPAPPPRHHRRRYRLTPRGQDLLTIVVGTLTILVMFAFLYLA